MSLKIYSRKLIYARLLFSRSRTKKFQMGEYLFKGKIHKEKEVLYKIAFALNYFNTRDSEILISRKKKEFRSSAKSQTLAATSFRITDGIQYKYERGISARYSRIFDRSSFSNRNF